MEGKITVVIAAHNGARTLGAQLSALTDSTKGKCEIIVVDNMSTDDSAAVAAGFPGVEVLSCATRGRCAARNIGVRASTGDKILICDQDDVVTSAWCDAMSAALDRYDVVGGPLDQDSLNDPFVRTTRTNIFENELPIREGVRQPTGANMGFRREVFDALDGFDEAFLNAGEDNDFSYRANALGFTIGFAPDAVVAYRLRTTAREAARQEANYTLASAQWRAKHRIHQPWKSKVLRAGKHCWKVVSFWRCRTRGGRFQYVKDVAAARAALTGYVRYRVVA